MLAPTPLDSGGRLRYRGSFSGIDDALEMLCEIVDTRGEGWRVRLAALRCPTDRGRRVSLQVEIVSPDWVSAHRERRSKRQQ